MEYKEALLFIQTFVQSPKFIGSIVPSSSFLGQKMANSVPWKEIHYAAELGAGTGAITKYLSQIQLRELVLFEQDERLRDNLAKAYPDFRCYPNALQMKAMLQQSGIGALDCIWSGLPFFNFSKSVRETLLEQISTCLKPGGWFVAFQYSLQMKKELSAKFNLQQIKFIPLNIPPAFLYVCRKKFN